MPGVIKRNGSAQVTGKDRYRLPVSLHLNGHTATLSVDIPSGSGITHLRFYAPGNKGQLRPVTPGSTHVEIYERDPVGPREHPHQIVSFAAVIGTKTYKSNPIKLRFARDGGSVPLVPVAVVTQPALSPAANNVGTMLTPTWATFSGDILERRRGIVVSTTNVAADFEAPDIPWTVIPNAPDLYFRVIDGARGVNGWVWATPTPIPQIVPRAAEAKLTNAMVDVDRAVYRPATQTTWRTPILVKKSSSITIHEMEYTAAANLETATWNPCARRPNETDRWDLLDLDDPVTDPATDAALFNEVGTGRAVRLRVRYRRYADQAWSEPSDPFTVPVVANLSGFTRFATDRATLATAIAASVAGDVIGLHPGDYSGDMTVTKQTTGDPIILRAVDMTNKPRVLTSQWTFNNARGFLFDGIYWLNTEKDAFGYPATGLNAVRFHNARRLTFRRCIFESFHSTLYGYGTEDIRFEYCHILRCGMDSIRLYQRNQRFYLGHCLFNLPDIDQSRAHEVDRHPDFLQFNNPENSNTLGTTDFLIENNVMITGNGYTQAIFLYNEKCGRGRGNIDDHGHQNGIVRGNYIETRHVHAITLSGEKNILVTGNLIRQFDPGAADARGADSPGDITCTPCTGNTAPCTGTVTNNVRPPRGGLGANALSELSKEDPVTGVIYRGDDSLLNKSGNKRSTIEVPDGWVMPLVGPANYPVA